MAALRRIALFYLIGMLINIALAIALSAIVDIGTGVTQSATGSDGSARWTLTTWSRPGLSMVYSHRERGVSWGPEQATGAPDAVPGTDCHQAWASATQDSQREWLDLDYAQPATPTLVRVHETFMPGAIDRITAFNDAGEEVEIWSGTDPSPVALKSAISDIPVKLNFKTRRIKLYIDSPKVPGWNEVDAVGLLEADGSVQWAVGASASSTYGQSVSSLATSTVGGVLPSWSKLGQARPPFRDHKANIEDRIARAAGWPMLALSAEQEGTPMVSPSGPVFTSSLTPMSTPLPTPQQTPLAVPLRPIWPGLAIDSALFAAILAVLYWLLVVPRRFFVEVSRLRRGCCIKCGYQLGYDFQHGCPDCGWGRNGEIPPPSSRV